MLINCQITYHTYKLRFNLKVNQFKANKHLVVNYNRYPLESLVIEQLRLK